MQLRFFTVLFFKYMLLSEEIYEYFSKFGVVKTVTIPWVSLLVSSLVLSI